MLEYILKRIVPGVDGVVKDLGGGEGPRIIGGGGGGPPLAGGAPGGGGGPPGPGMGVGFVFRGEPSVIKVIHCSRLESLVKSFTSMKSVSGSNSSPKLGFTLISGSSSRTGRGGEGEGSADFLVSCCAIQSGMVMISNTER